MIFRARLLRPNTRNESDPYLQCVSLIILMQFSLARSTVFLLEHCPMPIGCTTQCRLLTKIYWERNRNYVLVVKSNAVTIEVCDLS